MSTIKDIAKIAEVSHSTVSRALNNNPSIPEKTRERIKQIAQELDYVVNTNARSLNRNRTDVIGIILPEIFSNINCESFLTTLLGKVIRSCEKRHLGARTEFSKNLTNGFGNTKKLVGSNAVDGVLIIDNNYSQKDYHFLQENNVPHIFLHFKPDNFNSENINYVITDHVKGSYLATKYLIKQNHKNIINLAIGDFNHETRERIEGYKKALNENQIDNQLVKKGLFSFDDGYNFIKNNLSLFKEYTAIFAATDMIALGAIKSLKEAGFKIPEDISVVGYDDIDYSKYASPALTTIHQPIAEISDLAVEELFNLIEGKITTPIQMVIPPTLNIKKSVSKI